MYKNVMRVRILILLIFVPGMLPISRALGHPREAWVGARDLGLKLPMGVSLYARIYGGGEE